MKALLVRVGIDLTSEKKGGGHWLAPVNPGTNEFVYVPIPETEEVIPEYRTGYEGFFEPSERLGKRLENRFINRASHLDPDFSELTYGDIDCIDATDGNNHRGKSLLKLGEDDRLVFFAGLDPGRRPDRNVPLVQAIIGLYVIKESPKRATEIPNIEKYLGKNAHLRRDPKDKDIIVFAKPAPLSGRLEKCIPIAELNNGHYYLKENLFKEWGGFLDKDDAPLKNVHLQRTPLLQFRDPEKFNKWFNSYKYYDGSRIKLVQSNN